MQDAVCVDHFRRKQTHVERIACKPCVIITEYYAAVSAADTCGNNYGIFLHNVALRRRQLTGGTVDSRTRLGHWPAAVRMH